MPYPCTDDPNEIISAIDGIMTKERSFEESLTNVVNAASENAEKLEKFVNGGVTEEVQLGSGEPTPTLKNTVHLVKSAAAQLDGSDVSGKFSDAANGGQAIRMLADRFGDFVNVMDFGAVGDGVVDDTDAFADAAATGRSVFVPKGTYNVSRKVEGEFWSLDNVVIPYTRVWCAKFYEFQPKDFACGAATSAGGDFPSLSGYESNQWDRASQAPGFDLYDQILYIPGQVSNGKTHITVMKWSENELERVKLTRSTDSYGLTCHQCLGVYRPNIEDPVILIGAVNRYSTSVIDYSRNFTIGFYSYDYQVNSIPVQIKTMQAFSSAEVSELGLDSQTLMNVAVSPDGAVLVAEARKENGVYVIRIWDLHALMMGKITNLVTQYSHQFEATGAAGQGIWTDGRYIYFMSNASAAASYSSSIRHLYLHAWDFYGNDIGYYFIDTTTAENSFFGNDAAFAEVEGVFLAPWRGKLVPVVVSSFQRYINGASSYIRYNRYSLPTVAPFTSERVVARNINLQGELTATFQTALGTSPHELTTQRILFYAPAGNGDLNVGLASNSGLYIGAGECMDRVRTQMQNRVLSGLDTTTEALKMLADGRIVIHAGASSEAGEVFFEESERLAGLHVNSANNVFLVNATPLLGLAYSGISKGTLPADAIHARLAITANPTSLDEDYYFASIYHYASLQTGYHALTFYIHDETVSAANKNQSFQMRYTPNVGFENFMKAHLIPWNGNVFNLGKDGQRWDNGYFHTAVITGSDARLKQQVSPLEEAEKRVAVKCKSLIKKFKTNEAVEKKGANARIHVGVIAQEIKEAFESEGLNAERYGILCHASWDDEYEERVIREDEKGNIMETERVLVRPAGDEYSIRYEELLCFIIASI